MSVVYIGVDFHARSQTISWVDMSDGEIHELQLDHSQDDVGGFYKQFTGKVIVGLEASGYTRWFEELVEDLGHEVWLGDAAEIRRLARRRQKNDRRDAELILDLLVNGGFPRVHRKCRYSSEVLRQLRYRHRLVKIRTMACNCLQAIALSGGLGRRVKAGSGAGRKKIEQMKLSPIMAYQRKGFYELIDELDKKIEETEKWLRQQCAGDKQVARLQTHPGIGLLTSLALVHTLDPVERFSSTRKVAAYVGLDPMEDSSADRKRYHGVSKAGSKLLRFLLVEAGQTAARRDPRLRCFSARLSRGRHRGKVKVAVARKLVVRAFIMMRDQIDYMEFLCRGLKGQSKESKAGRESKS